MSALPSIEPAATALEAEQTRALYEQYSRRIFGYCLRRLPSREEAEDAVQHTFMNAFGGLRKGVVPRSEVAWLFKIAENVCRERRRSAWRRGRVESAQDPDALQNLAVAPEGSHDELAGLADALAELPPNQRRAILLREWQGLSYKEIAAELELTDAAVETLLFRARRSLAHKLDRSRSRSWGLNLGSLAAWGKSLLGGAAVKVAAATLVVAAGVTAATPSLRGQLVGRNPAPAPQPVGSAPARTPTVGAHLARPLAASSRGPGALTPLPARRAVKPEGRTAPPTAGTAAAPGTTQSAGSGESGSGTSIGPAPVAVPATVPVSVPVPVPVTVPPVSVPTQLPVQAPPVPPIPPVPTVTVPDLPSVQLPDLPKLP
jgi:RNA polymerase sigma factor (sigma-70 family)